MATVNPSGITPCGHRILIEPLKVEEKTRAGVIIASGDTLSREQMAQDKGRVISVGPDAWSDQETKQWAQPGDIVVFAKHAGNLWRGLDGTQYRLVNDLDIVALLDPEVV